MRFLSWLFSARYRRLLRVRAERRRRNTEREGRRQADLKAKLIEMYSHAPTCREARRLLEMIRTRY